MKTASAFSVLLFIAILALAPAASAQYSQDFDGLNASPTGVVLTGQDGYYLPNGPPGDVDFLVYTYAGNALGIDPNPQGGTQFIAGTGPGGTTYARAQRAVNLGFGVWEAVYDFCGLYTGAPPGTNNIGSFSMRLSTNTVHINLFTWVDLNNPTTINSTYVYYDQNSTQSPIPGTPPGPAWSNLQVNHWYRCRTVFDFDQNLIIEVAIRDLSGGPEAVYFPTNWYLYGGANPVGLPDAFRFFGGGGGAGNTTAWDNALIQPQATPEGACCLDNGDCVITPPDQCAGDYQGNGSDCEPNPCPPIPVEQSTWGRIKNRFH